MPKHLATPAKCSWLHRMVTAKPLGYTRRQHPAQRTGSGHSALTTSRYRLPRVHGFVRASAQERVWSAMTSITGRPLLERTNNTAAGQATARPARSGGSQPVNTFLLEHVQQAPISSTGTTGGDADDDTGSAGRRLDDGMLAATASAVLADTVRQGYLLDLSGHPRAGGDSVAELWPAHQRNDDHPGERGDRQRHHRTGRPEGLVSTTKRGKPHDDRHSGREGTAPAARACGAWTIAFPVASVRT